MIDFLWHSQEGDIPHYVFPVISTQIIDGYNPVLSNYSRDVGLSPLLILKHQEKKTK